MYNRGHDAGWSTRHLAAIIASGNRTGEPLWVTALTVVIHGTPNRLVGPSGGRATAPIPGCLDRGMGHDLPLGAWPQILAAIVGQGRVLPARRRRRATPSPRSPTAAQAFVITARRDPVVTAGGGDSSWRRVGGGRRP